MDGSFFSRWIELKLPAVAEPTEPGEYVCGGAVIVLLPVTRKVFDDPDGLAMMLPTIEEMARTAAAPIAERERLTGPYEIRVCAGVPQPVPLDNATDSDTGEDDPRDIEL